MTFKQKWDNYWYHYKAITFAAIFAAIILFVGFYSCSRKTVPDLHMVYLSNTFVEGTGAEDISLDLEDAVVGDVNNDNKTDVYMDCMVVSFDVNVYTDESTLQKLQTVLYGGQHTLMLVHEYALEDYDGIFEDLTDVVEEGDKTYISPSEKFVSGISLAGNKYLESYGINTENLYIAMRRRRPEDIKNGKEKEYFDAAYNVMNFILNHQR